jgi:hypothetical protein
LSVIVREGNRLMDVGHWVKRKTVGHERAGVTEYWEKLQIAKRHGLYCSANIIKMNKSKTYDGQGM